MLQTVGAMTLVAAVGAWIGNFFYQLAIQNNTDKQKVFKAPHNSGAAPERSRQMREAAKEWAAKMNFSHRFITSHDNLKLHGLYLQQRAKTNRYAVICHGYHDQCERMLVQGKEFYQMGFHLLIPDARGHGDSEGSYIGMGWHDRLDLLSWIRWIVLKNPQAEIVLYGVSMGAATVMMVSGEPLPPNVKVIVEDCGFTSVWDEFCYQLKKLYHLPSFPVMQAASITTRIKAGFWFSEASAVKQVRKTKLPILFIHGDRDTFVPFKMVNCLYEAAAGPKELAIVSGAGHGQAMAVEGRRYWQRISDFIFSYIE